MLGAALVNHSLAGIEEALGQTPFARADGYSKVEVYPTSAFNDFGEGEDHNYLTITQYNPKDKNSAQTHAVLVSGWELFPDEAERIAKHLAAPDSR